MFDVFYSGKKPGRFVHERRADNVEHAQKLSRTRYFWWIHYLADLDSWNWLFEPLPWQADQRHAWPNQHQPDSGIYLVPRGGYTDTNYHASPMIHHSADAEYWHIPKYIDPASIDSQWSPDPMDPPYIYHFPVEWGWDNIGGPEYRVPGATQRKYVNHFTARTRSDGNLKVLAKISDADPVRRWQPDPTEPPYIYIFGNQWWSGEIMPTAEYAMPGAVAKKYLNRPRATILPCNNDCWRTLIPCEWDRSWIPDPGDPPYIYVFGNQWWSAEKMPTMEYHVPGATQRKFMDYPKAKLLTNKSNWAVITDKNIEFDFTWVPDPGEPPMTYIFGNQWHTAEVMPTLRYRADTVTDNNPVKYVDWPRVALLPNQHNWFIPQGIDIESVDQSWCPDPGAPAYIYQFGTQWQRTGGPVYTVPGATEVRYEHRPRVIKTSVDANWSVPDGVETGSFDWTWHPDATDPPFIYQFGTQHQRTGGPQYTVPGATDIKFVDQIRIHYASQATPIVEIDHLDGTTGQIPNTVHTMRYFDNYRDTLIRLAKKLNAEYEWIWVCSSICDYSKFDFSWHPEQWQATMLHVFKSDNEKFGDTFFMHVPTFRDRAEKKALLEWYDVNFVDVSVPRRPMPVIVHDSDSQVDAVKTAQWAGPLATFTNHDYVPGNLVTVPLWREQTKAIVPVSNGAGTVVVPRVAVPYIKTQLYDYAYIDRSQRMLQDLPLDIVFISNGEINAEDNWMLLENRIVNLGTNHTNHLHRVDGINGRVAAYHAAAQASTTPWFFAVFAKLTINFKFDWSWQPDRMQQPKHYIFHAHNPINGLVYGHQAMIAYNKNLVLMNQGLGLDFTLDQPHEVVPIISGTANYHESDWMCWRTAFREVLKLKASAPDVENEHRLRTWLGVDHTDGAWSRKGAEDAVEYYDSVGGDLKELQKSYEWSWLASYAFMKRSLTLNQ